MPQDLLSKLRRIGRKLEPATTVSESTNEQPPEAPAIEQEGPSEASAVVSEHTTAPEVAKVNTVAGFKKYEEYAASVSVKEAGRGKQENANRMWIKVEDYEGDCLCEVANRHKWRPHERLTVIFSGTMVGPWPVFGHKYAAGDAKRR
jgi:hypothetical protein